MQRKLVEYPLENFKCPIGNETYKDVYDHDKKCIYKYCKDDKWKWSKGLI